MKVGSLEGKKKDAMLFSVFVISSIIFLFLGYRAYFNERLSIDHSLNSYVSQIQTVSFTPIAKFIAYAFDTVTVVVLSLIFAIYLFYIGHKRKSLFFSFAMLGDAAIISALKTIVHAARPANAIMSETTFAFPSGHATTSVVFLGLLLFFHWNSVKKEGKVLLSLVYVALVLFIGFTRIYLNVHWFSDVVGGIALGAAWLVFSLYIFKKLDVGRW